MEPAEFGPFEDDYVDDNYRYVEEGTGRRYRLSDLTANKAGGDTDYPTQKPEALMERIIAASSEEDDVVLDAFCGCGTTIAVAQRMRRRWIGIDISPTAVGLMKRRVETAGAIDVTVEGLPVTSEDLKELRPFAFQNWVIQRIHGTPTPRKSGDMGIDGYSFMEGLPVQVKQSERVGRGVIDGFETAIERAGKHKGFLIAFSFTRGAREEAARVKGEKGIEIELVPVSALVEGAPDRITPQLEHVFPGLPRSFLDLPLPPARPRSARPSAEELVRSDKRAS